MGGSFEGDGFRENMTMKDDKTQNRKISGGGQEKVDTPALGMKGGLNSPLIPRKEDEERKELKTEKCNWEGKELPHYS